MQINSYLARRLYGIITDMKTDIGNAGGLLYERDRFQPGRRFPSGTGSHCRRGAELYPEEEYTSEYHIRDCDIYDPDTVCFLMEKTTIYSSISEKKLIK